MSNVKKLSTLVQRMINFYEAGNSWGRSAMRSKTNSFCFLGAAAASLYVDDERLLRNTPGDTFFVPTHEFKSYDLIESLREDFKQWNDGIRITDANDALRSRQAAMDLLRSYWSSLVEAGR